MILRTDAARRGLAISLITAESVASSRRFFVCLSSTPSRYQISETCTVSNCTYHAGSTPCFTIWAVLGCLAHTFALNSPSRCFLWLSTISGIEPPLGGPVLGEQFDAQHVETQLLDCAKHILAMSVWNDGNSQTLASDYGCTKFLD
jgi:hypothetical protein